MSAFLIDSNGIIINQIVLDSDENFTGAIYNKDVAGIPIMGKFYDNENNSVYYKTSPIKGWILNRSSWEYIPPIEDPSTRLKHYEWNEQTEKWMLTEERKSEDDKWEPID